MHEVEYLVSQGRSGDFGRYLSQASTICRRGDRVVIRADHGLEIGTVLCEATSGHARFLSRTGVGKLIRIASNEDDQLLEKLHQRGQQVFDHARRLAREMALPLEILDVEVLLDGQQAVVYHLRREECDYRPLVSTLSREHDLQILLENLAVPVEFAEDEDHEDNGGCGRPGCGETGGGCTSCGSGGCSTCGKGGKSEDIAAQLAGLRRKMDERARTSLL